MIKQFDESTFRDDIAEGPVMVEFFSKTCGPCKMLNFILQDIDKTYGDEVSIVQVSFEENPDLVEEFGVEGYPTMIMLKDGEEVDRKQGLQQKPVVEKLIKEAI